ncbi:MAG: hypothetical protein AAGA17_19585 [Actinomycetota bacterium]
MDDAPSTMMDTAQIRAVESMEERLGTQAWDDAAPFFTDDVRYQVGTRPPVFGLGGIQSSMQWQSGLVEWRGHDVRAKVNLDDVVIIEVDSKFLRHADGHDIVIPCTDVYRMQGLRIADWRVYADISAFHGP